MATNNSINLSLSGQTGTGSLVGSNTPTLVAPSIGAATGASINLGSSTTIDGFIDDDTMATASATTGATSESIKSYVDANTATALQNWTPVPKGSSTAGSPSGTFSGQYLETAGQVFITGKIVFSDLDTMAGNFQIGGLPVTASTSSTHRAGIVVSFRNNFTNDYVMCGYTNASDTIGILRADIDNTTIGIADLSATSNLYFSMWYIKA